MTRAEEICRKKRVYTQQRAWREAQKPIKDHGELIWLEPYKCPVCGNWHLTSKR